MITVTGQARLRVQYTVRLEMTTEEFDALSERKQNALLEDAIDWYEASKRTAEVDDIDVDDVQE